jgi:hypothetical protein
MTGGDYAGCYHVHRRAYGDSRQDGTEIGRKGLCSDQEFLAGKRAKSLVRR